ncbi:hypothetical protein MASR2M15_23670 [Anaerolineales bacterium]
MSIYRINHVQISIPSDGETLARQFYCDLLGLEEIEKPISLQDNGGFWLILGDQELHIGIQDQTEFSKLRTHIAYEVEDLDTWWEKLADYGPQENTEIPGYDRFECRDPFGNRLEIIQPITELTYPSNRYKYSYLEAVQEFIEEGKAADWNLDMLIDEFDLYVQTLIDQSQYPDANKVAATELWLVYGSDYVGRLSIRHTLNDALLQFGGHIGYEIRPSMRRQGFATESLIQGLEIAAELGLTRVLLTCDDDNYPSQRIIEGAGGVLENKVDNGRPSLTRRYWIDIKPA